MSKGRVITGFGPALITLDSTVPTTSTTAWMKFGPFSGNTLTGTATFADTATSQSVRVEAVLSTSSTGTADIAMPFGDLTSASGSSYGPKRSSGATSNYAFVRLHSSELSIMSTAQKVKVWLVAGNPSS